MPYLQYMYQLGGSVAFLHYNLLGPVGQHALETMSQLCTKHHHAQRFYHIQLGYK